MKAPGSRDLIDLLLHQLKWPSGMVRERACVAIATLFGDDDTARELRPRLLAWLSEQPLESVAAHGLLVFIYAKMQGVQLGITTQDFASALSRPSILSWLLLQDLDHRCNLHLKDSLAHSGTAPRGFRPKEFFGRHNSVFVPPIYDIWADRLKAKYGIPFHRQWSFEWQRLHQNTNCALSTRPLQFWTGVRKSDARYVAVDTHMSEVYRSAYLRALAWAVESGELPAASAMIISAQFCPLDLELWELVPRPIPVWWPRPSKSSITLDTVPGQVWQHVRDLWEKQRRGVNWSAHDTLGGEHVLAHASGRVHDNTAVYDLELYGVFQKCHGREAPELSDVADWLASDQRSVHPYLPNLLRFRGVLQHQPLADSVEAFDDWSVLPSAQPAKLATIPRWQFWRMFRGVWLPATSLSDVAFEFGCHDGAIVAVENRQNNGEWRDWTAGLTETLVGEVPPESGNYLLLPRDLVEEFATTTKSTFCWIARLTVFSRDSQYDEYDEFTDCQAFGTTSVIQ